MYLFCDLSISQLPSTTLATAVTDVSGLLQCLGSLARAVSIGLPVPLPPHRSWDTVKDPGLRMCLVSQFSSIETMLEQIISAHNNSRASKCEALRWTAMLFPPWHPSYRYGRYCHREIFLSYNSEFWQSFFHLTPIALSLHLHVNLRV